MKFLLCSAIVAAVFALSESQHGGGHGGHGGYGDWGHGDPHGGHGGGGGFGGQGWFDGPDWNGGQGGFGPGGQGGRNPPGPQPGSSQFGPRCPPEETQRTLELTTRFMREAFVNNNASSVSMYSAKMINHNADVRNNQDLVDFINGNKNDSNFRFEAGGIAAHCDIAFIYGVYFGMAPAPAITVDIFRAKNGIFTEHWDIRQLQVNQTASGAPMYAPMWSDYPTKLQANSPMINGPECSPEQTQQTLQTVTTFKKMEAIDLNPAAVNMFASNFIQHDPYVKSPADLVSFIQNNKKDPKYKYEAGGIVGNCDIAMVYGRYFGTALQLPSIVVDIFRVRRGVITEHWDVSQDQVNQTASGVPIWGPMWPNFKL